MEEDDEWLEPGFVKIKIVLHVLPADAEILAFQVDEYIKRLKHVQGYNLFIVRTPDDEPDL